MLTGGGLQAGGSVASVGGLSSDATQARNLRGKNIAADGGFGQLATIGIRQPVYS
jgi:hypothetical protein